MSKILEAMNLLKQLNVPKQQQNERSALALLALLDLKERGPWSAAKKTLIRIHDIMQFIKVQYDHNYAENSRETFRRQTLHQFEQEVGIVERNANDSLRSTNSPNTTWSVTADFLTLVRAYKKSEWKRKLPIFLKKIKRSPATYLAKRSKNKLTIILEGEEINLSPGKHNELQLDVINGFKSHFCHDAVVLYLGDTAHKMLYANQKMLKTIGLKLDKHAVLPDIILLDRGKDRLYLIEAVASHGPVSNKRLIELNKYFSAIKLKKIFVSAFPNFKEFKRHVDAVAWETEVWLSDMPNHMIHFNGDKFLKMD